MAMENGVAKMRPVEGGLEIKPGETVQLKPGSFHVMLMGLKQPLDKGQKIKGTLQFEKAGKVEIEYTVEALGATSPGTMSPECLRWAGTSIELPALGNRTAARAAELVHQPIVLGSHSASPGKRKHSTRAMSCIATNGTIPR